ncbi:hypothetical protein D3C75_646480 [compost metagenome]
MIPDPLQTFEADFMIRPEKLLVRIQVRPRNPFHGHDQDIFRLGCLGRQQHRPILDMGCPVYLAIDIAGKLREYDLLLNKQIHQTVMK